MSEWHIVTGEYPPQIGGVSDYTRQVASGLAAAGEKVHVWCPLTNSHANSSGQDNGNGVVVHRELGRLTPNDLRRAGRIIESLPKPKRLLVQWVPHGYGFRSMNLPFCLWLWKRARVNGDAVELMVHEPFLPFGGSWRQSVAATVHRLMTTVVLGAAKTVWMSIPSWEKHLRPYVIGAGPSFKWLPVPSVIPVASDTEETKKLRSRYAPAGELLVGHFGAYDDYMEELLISLVPSMIDTPTPKILLLLGKGSEEVRKKILASYPGYGDRLHATGTLATQDISKHISACDVMWQPYQDGVSARRTSVMAALSHGIPVVTNRGPATERLWEDCATIKLASIDGAGEMIDTISHSLSDATLREEAQEITRRFYDANFDVRQIIHSLMAPAGQARETK